MSSSLNAKRRQIFLPIVKYWNLNKRSEGRSVTSLDKAYGAEKLTVTDIKSNKVRFVTFASNLDSWQLTLWRCDVVWKYGWSQCREYILKSVKLHSSLSFEHNSVQWIYQNRMSTITCVRAHTHKLTCHHSQNLMRYAATKRCWKCDLFQS